MSTRAVARGAGHPAGSRAGTRSARRVVPVAAALALVTGLAVGGLAWRAGAGARPGPAGAPVQTTTVTRTDLSTSQTLSGTLGYGSAVPVNGSRGGIVTWLPASGARVSRGQPLYRVDNQPVPLFYGRTPLYRTLDEVGMTGPDVKMIAANLAALGYDIGYQPPAGSVITQQPSPAPAATGHARSKPAGQATPGAEAPGSTATPARPSAPPVTVTVGRGDAVLTGSLIDAIRLWQAAAGMTPSGTLGVGDVMVEPGAVQVASLQAQLGGPASGALMTVTATTKTVTLSADTADVPSLRHSGTVTITLPGGSATTGRITSISSTVQSAQTTSDSQPQQAVTISLEHPAAAAELSSASVQVVFTGQTRTGVLAVPVGALLALSGGGYAVQLAHGRLIPVRTGMFAQGMVQISGPGIVPGLRVVTTT